jgi:hypothetical protein
MSRKLWVFSTVTLFGVSALVAGIGATRNAAACDDAAKKTASATSASSCCAKDGTSSASVDAKKVHNSIIKSAIVAPGAAPILNVAAFGGMMYAGGNASSCDWCPTLTTASVNAAPAGCAEMTSAECASKMTSAECAAKMSAASASGCAGKSAAARTASYEALPAGHPAITTAEAGHPGCGGTASAAKVASSEGCGSKTVNAAQVASSDCCAGKGASAAKVASNDNFTVKNASVTLAAGGEGCDKGSSASAAGYGARAGASCCDSKDKTASAAGAGEKCSSATTASLKGKVDEMPYRENKRVVLAGSYACGHCTLEKTEDCSPMLKTADGKVYPLLQNNQAKDMRAKEGKNLEVSGTVKKVDGVKFLEVKSYKVI